jgi:hypothetical protein
MIAQALFLTGLYAVGVYLGLLFRKQVDLLFIILTGFLWGSLTWVLVSLVLLSVGLPYSFYLILPVLLVVVALAGVLHGKRGTLRLSQREWILTGASQVLFAGITFAAISSMWFFGTHDTIFVLIMSQIIAMTGFQAQWVIASPMAYGIYIPILQATDFHWNDEILLGVQASLGVTLLATMLYSGWRILKENGLNNRPALWLSITGALALASTPFMVFLSFYFQTNLATAVFLLAALFAAWMFMAKGETGWLWFAMAALLGFSLCRTETPVIGLVFLALLVSTGRLDYRLRLRAFTPYILIITVWTVRILFMDQNVYRHLAGVTGTAAIAGLQIAFLLFIILTKFKWIEGHIMRNLHWIMLGMFTMVLAGMFILKTERMLTGLKGMVGALFMWKGWWGASWMAAVPLLLPALFYKPTLNNRIFIFGIPLYFMFILGLNYSSVVPYYADWMDSANRMATHILPLMFLFLIVKYGSLFNTEKLN